MVSLDKVAADGSASARHHRSCKFLARLVLMFELCLCRSERYICAQVYRLAQFPCKADSDFPESSLQERNALADDQLGEALGVERSADPTKRRFWMLMNGLGTHDLSAMRELIGMPQYVTFAKMHGAFGNVVFQ